MLFTCDYEADTAHGAGKGFGRIMMVRAGGPILLGAALTMLLIVSGCAPAEEADSTSPDSPLRISVKLGQRHGRKWPRVRSKVAG